MSVVNLLPKNLGDFETGSCNDSGQFRSALEGSDVAHSGAHSCQICRAEGQDASLWSIDNFFSVVPQLGQEYRATVWVRRPPGSTDTLSVAVVLRTFGQDDDQLERQESDSVTLSDAWQQLSTSLTLAKVAKEMDTYTYAVNEAGIVSPCFLADDYVVWQIK